MAIQSVKISDVKSNPNNPRLIKDDKFAKLVQSLKDFPEMANVRPIVVNQDFVVLGGNMRLKAMKEAGWKEVPVQVVDWSEQQQKEFIIKDNVGFGEWEWDMLANEWEAEDLEKWGLDVPGFVEEPEAEEDDFDVPDGGIETDIVVGDLFEIGEHRLLCGDSTDSDAVAKLMDGQKADLLLTDPPYGIGYAGSMKLGQKKFGWKQHSGGWDESKPEDGTLEYLTTITTNQIIWGGNYFTDNLPPTMGWLIWDKGQRDFSLADGEMAWTSFDNALRILTLSRAEANREEKNHATQKPVRLINWCFEYADRHSKEAIKLVLDAYLGSGTTMVASHQLNRKCYGMELDPKYCQVIVDRMLKLDPNLIIKRNGEVYLKSDENQTNNGVSA
jgi:DNA modification methylase